MLAPVNGITISYDISPAPDPIPAAGAGPRRPTVVLCSGAGEGPDLWQLALGPDLVDAGFQIVTYAYRGIEPSSRPDGPVTMAEVVGDAIGLIEHLVDVGSVAGLVSLVGYSSGGWVVCEVARHRPDLVACVSTIAGIGRSPAYERLWLQGLLEVAHSGTSLSPSAAATSALPMLLGPSSMQDDQVVAGWHRLLVANASGPSPTVGHWAAWQEWAEGPDDKHLDEIQSPVQIVAFEHDIFLSPALAEAAAAQIVGADVDLVIVDECGHLGLFEHSELIVPSIVQFLLDHAGPARHRAHSHNRARAHDGDLP